MPPPDPRNILPVKTLDLELLWRSMNRPLHGFGLVKAISEHPDGLPELEPASLHRVTAAAWRTD